MLCAQLLSRARLSWAPWTVAHQAPLSVEFSRQEHWSGLPCCPPGGLPCPGTEPVSPSCPALQGDSLALSPQGAPSSVGGKYEKQKVLTAVCCIEFSIIPRSLLAPRSRSGFDHRLSSGAWLMALVHPWTLCRVWNSLMSSVKSQAWASLMVQ